MLALGVLALVVVGCAQPNTVPTPTPVPLTVAEFAARVCDPVDLDVGVTWGKVRAKLRADIDRAGRIVPPEELVDWYLASLATIKAALKAIQNMDMDMGAMFNPYELATDADLMLSVTLSEAAEATISAETRAILFEAGCFR